MMQLTDSAGSSPVETERFGKYEVLAKLGGDGAAEVLQCRDHSPEADQRVVIVRRMRAGLVESPSLARLFLAEARLALILSHPSIARVYEVDELEATPYMAVEHVSGPTLAQIIDQAWTQKKSCARVVARILGEIAGALAHAHLACDPRGRPLGIVHRDVTLQNIALASGEEPKLLDFGVLRLPRRTTSGSCARSGRLFYLAPEQLRGAFADGRSDVFSVGVCLYLAATGLPPYPSGDEVAVQQAVSRGAFLRPSVANPFIEPELEEIIEWAMNPRVERRPSALALRQALDAYASQGVDRVTLPTVGTFVRELLGASGEAREAPQASADGESRPFFFSAKLTLHAPAAAGSPNTDVDGWPQSTAVGRELPPDAPTIPTCDTSPPEAGWMAFLRNLASRLTALAVLFSSLAYVHLHLPDR